MLIIYDLMTAVNVDSSIVFTIILTHSPSLCDHWFFADIGDRISQSDGGHEGDMSGVSEEVLSGQVACTPKILLRRVRPAHSSAGKLNARIDHISWRYCCHSWRCCSVDFFSHYFTAIL